MTEKDKVQQLLVWDLVPTVRVGHFILGDDIEQYKEKFSLSCVPHSDLDSDQYDILGTDSFLSVDRDGKIIYVDCYDSCIYNGNELIGMEYSKLLETLGAPPDEIDEKAVVYDSGYAEYSVTFREPDLIVWVELQKEVVKSVHCGEGDWE